MIYLILIILFIFLLLSQNYYEHLCSGCKCSGCKIPTDANGNCQWLNKTDKCCPQHCTNYNPDNKNECKYDNECENCSNWTKWKCVDNSCNRINDKLYANKNCN